MTTHASVTEIRKIVFVPDRAGLAAWQAEAAGWRPECLCVDAGLADDPRRNPWLGRIDRAVAAAEGPVVLAAHGLGSVAVAWWGGLLGRRAGRRVVGALLVAPAQVDQDPRLAAFAPSPTAMLPFPAIVASGGGDPDHARACAAEWVSDVCDADGSDAIGSLIDMLIAGGPGLSRYAYRPAPPSRPASRPVRPEPRPVTQRL